MRLRLILAACALAACGGGPGPAAPSCPSWFPDADGDGFGDGAAAPVTACEPPDGHVGNPYDCDDTESSANPLGQERCDPDDVDEDCNGVADNDDPDSRGRIVDGWPDTDGDGHASPESAALCDLTEGWFADAGRDCDDGDPAVHPHADDTVDGVDTNCDGFDGPALHETFESGGPDPEVWTSSDGLRVEQGWAPEGDFGASLWDASVVETVSIDTSGCDGLAWHYQVMSYTAWAPLLVEYWDGAGWQLLDQWHTTAPGHWTHRWGTVEDSAVLHADFRVRLHTTDPDVVYYLDRLLVGCRSESDEDGVPDGIDCASSDPLHWFDCDRCTDDDADGFGAGCDLGRDCDDADASAHPGAPDPLDDGLDADCTGLDGPELFDDFDDGPDGTVWHPLVRASVEPIEAGSPNHRLAIQGQGMAFTPPLDLSGCDGGVWWEYLGAHQGYAHHDPVLTLSWEGPEGWIQADEWPADEASKFFTLRRGVVLDPEAARSGRRFRFATSTETWWVDDLHVACFVDADADGMHDPRDCAPDDPLHWFDCGQCVDIDGDGRGVDCDLGEDCDETRTDIHSGAPDPMDGLDQDCDGIDGPVLLQDDFEAAGPLPATWTLVDDISVLGPSPGEPTVYVRFSGATGVLEAAPVDTSACSAVGWRIRGRAYGFEVDEHELAIEYWDGAAWSALEQWQPPASYSAWFDHVDAFGGATALRPDLRVRLRGLSGHFDRVDVEEFALGCAPL